MPGHPMTDDFVSTYTPQDPNETETTAVHGDSTRSRTIATAIATSTATVTSPSAVSAATAAALAPPATAVTTVSEQFEKIADAAAEYKRNPLPLTPTVNHNDVDSESVDSPVMIEAPAGSSGISNKVNGAGRGLEGAGGLYVRQSGEQVVGLLDELVRTHDVCFALTDSREARYHHTV
jgi:hypothetical protein